MINQASLQTIAEMKFGDGAVRGTASSPPQFIRPAYGSYCFSHIPDTIRQAFGLLAGRPLPGGVLPDGQAYDRVIFFFLDAFGWQLFEKLADHPFLRRFTQQGVASQLTSMFPSTTSAHTTCIHTGIDLAESGVHEWYYYEPEVDLVISPLMYTVPGRPQREWLAQRGVSSRSLFPTTPTLYQELGTHGVTSTVFQSREYAGSTFSQHVCRGAEIVPFETWTEALFNLRSRLSDPRRPLPEYYFLYFAGVDSISHRYGPRSPQAEAEALTLLDLMDRFLQAGSRPEARTLLLVSADHGQADISPQTTFSVNLRFPDFDRYLRRNRIGDPLHFSGSPRDLFIYVEETFLEEVHALLATELAGRAEVYPTRQLMEQGLFGPTPSARLSERIGSLAVLPYNGHGVFWHIPGKFEQPYYGHHGGLSPQEMLIPFLALDI